MRLPLAIYFILAATVMASAVPDRTTRRGLKAVAPTAVNAVAMRHDTVTPSPGMIDVAGYDKPLRSSRETLFVTNRSSRTLKGVELRIIYLDAKGRQLHEAVHWLPSDIPPGETRRLSFKSWDLQRTFYYRLTGRPRTSDGTMYDVSIRPLRAAYTRVPTTQSSGQQHDP